MYSLVTWSYDSTQYWFYFYPSAHSECKATCDCLSPSLPCSIPFPPFFLATIAADMLHVSTVPIYVTKLQTKTWWGTNIVVFVCFLSPNTYVWPVKKIVFRAHEICSFHLYTMQKIAPQKAALVGYQQQIVSTYSVRCWLDISNPMPAYLPPI